MFDTTVELLKKYQNIAVYGMSKNPGKAAHSVPKYMDSHGYNIIPVNPTTDEIDGKKSYSTLADVEGDIDILNVFRPSGEAVQIVKEAIKRKKDKGDLKAVWLQLGIFDDDARRLAEENGLEYVENACMLVEHGKL